MFGLENRQMELIIEAIKKETAVDKAVVFGSRAMGNYKKGSDIDIALFGPRLSNRAILKLYDVLSEELPLPYVFDLLHYEEINNADLKTHIDEKGVCIFEK